MEVDFSDDLLRIDLTQPRLSEDVKTSAVQKMRKLLNSTDRTEDDYEFMGRFVLYIQFFADLDYADRQQYLKVSRGVSLTKGQMLFNIGDPADSFYCVISGSLNVVIDLTRVHITTKREMNDIMNRAKVYSCLHNPGVGMEESPFCTSYVVRSLNRFDSFGDVGMLTVDGTRTAAVVAYEDTFLLRINREAFLDCRVFHESKDLNQKLDFISKVTALQHFDRENKLKVCGRMERILKSYNDVVVAQDDDAQHFYLIQLGQCRLVKRIKKSTFVEIGTISNGQYFGSYEVIRGHPRASFSVIVSSPSAILYRMDKLDFRHHILRDSIVEQMMRADVEDLYARMHPESIQRDLFINTQWNKCKESIVTETSYIRPLKHGLHPSPLQQPAPPLPNEFKLNLNLFPSTEHNNSTSCDGVSELPAPKSTNSKKTRKAMNSLRPMSVDAASQKLYLGHQHWIQWASNRVANVSIADIQSSLSPTTGVGAIHRTTRILMGGNRKIQVGENVVVPESVAIALKDLRTKARSSSPSDNDKSS